MTKHTSDGSKSEEILDSDQSVPQPGHANNSNINSNNPVNPCTFSSLRSLDMKFSPDGDEVVLEMSDMMRAVPEGAAWPHAGQLIVEAVSPAAQTARNSVDQSYLSRQLPD